jgi:hypothetical protein
MRLVAAIAVLPLGAALAHADITVVQQDRTPIVSAPGVGGRILARVDTGFTLTVLGREGDWLEVASPQLNLTGRLWVPAGRVGDIIAAPAEGALPEAPVAATAITPLFRITGMTRDVTTASSVAMPATLRGSNGASAAISRGANGAAQATSGATEAAAAATPAADNAVPSENNPTPAVGNSSQPVGSVTPAVGNSAQPVGNPTPAVGNPTAPVGNAVPAVGSTSPAVGNPTPAMGNSTPAMGGTVVSIGFHN